MFSKIKKHPVCTVFLILPFVIYGYLYFTDFRYDADKRDFRHYPIPPLTEKWTKTIEYKTLPNVKFRKCFLLSFNSEKLENNVNKMFGKDFVNRVSKFKEHTIVSTYYDEVYQRKYTLFHIDDITEEEFYSEAKEKPHFWLKIYKDGVLLETRELYFTDIRAGEKIKAGDREFYTLSIIGRPGYKQKKCYTFSENSEYRLEIINDQVIHEFQDVEVFFTIRPINPKV